MSDGSEKPGAESEKVQFCTDFPLHTRVRARLRTTASSQTSPSQQHERGERRKEEKEEEREEERREKQQVETSQSNSAWLACHFPFLHRQCVYYQRIRDVDVQLTSPPAGHIGRATRFATSTSTPWIRSTTSVTWRSPISRTPSGPHCASCRHPRWPFHAVSSPPYFFSRPKSQGELDLSCILFVAFLFRSEEKQKREDGPPWRSVARGGHAETFLYKNDRQM